MKQSLRSFLTFNLLLSVGFVSLIAISGNVFFKYRDVKPHLDAQLSLASLNMGALLNEYNEPEDLLKLQNRINHIPAQIKNIHSDSHDMDMIMESALKSVQFQIWNDQDEKILSSPGSPEVALNRTDGFHYVTNDGIEWRTFTMPIPETKKYIVAFQRRDIRTGFERQVIYDSILIIGLTFALLTIAVWLIINRGLQGLDQAATELRERDPANLEPLQLETTPTELEPLVDAINQLFKKLEDALERERRFAGDAAHEMKTPISAIKTLSQTLKNVNDPQKVTEIADNIIIGVDRATHIIDQLLTLSRTVPDAMQSTAQQLNLSSVAAETIAELTPRALESKKTIALQCKDNIQTHASKTAVQIILRNLLDNAINYTPDGTSIKVIISQNPNQTVLTVEDNGGGVEPQHLGHLTKRFYRIYGNDVNGSGLGLNIIDKLINLYGGEISIDNALSTNDQMGLTVKLTLPNIQ